MDHVSNGDKFCYHVTCRKDLDFASRQPVIATTSSSLSIWHSKCFDAFCDIYIYEKMITSGKVYRVTTLILKFNQYVQEFYTDLTFQNFSSHYLKSQLITKFGADLVFIRSQRRNHVAY